MEEQFKKALSNPDNLPTILNNIWNTFEALRLGYKLEGPISQRAFEGGQMNENSNDEAIDYTYSVFPEQLSGKASTTGNLYGVYSLVTNFEKSFHQTFLCLPHGVHLAK